MTMLSEGQVAIITGGASGIGLGLAMAFADRGLKVVIADNRPDALESALGRLTTAGADALSVETDVSRPADVQRLADVTIERFGTFDIVCNNAGTASTFAPTWEVDLAAWKRIIDVNVWSVIFGIRTFVPHLVAKGSGHILNTASMTGLTVVPRYADYAMSKHAVVSITETLRADLDALAPGVTATVLCPGLVRTPLGMGARYGVDSNDDALEQPGADQPAGSSAVRPEPLEVSDAVECAISAIESNRLYAVLSRHPEQVIRARVDRLIKELGEQPRITS